jgi:hypothetical protein
LRRAGMYVDLQEMEWGTALRRWQNQAAPDKGGWNVLFTLMDRSLPNTNPYGNPWIRADGLKAYGGWPTSPRIEALRAAWLDAASHAAKAPNRSGRSPTASSRSGLMRQSRSITTIMWSPAMVAYWRADCSAGPRCRPCVSITSRRRRPAPSCSPTIAWPSSPTGMTGGSHSTSRSCLSSCCSAEGGAGF